MLYIFLFNQSPNIYIYIYPNDIGQDGEIWTFTVRAFESTLPERTINVNYDGFAEG